MKHKTRTISPLLLLAALAAPTVLPAQWPQWGGPGRDFTSSDPGLADSWPEASPPELWRRPLGDGYSGIALADGRLFTMVRDGGRDAVIALDAASGETLWRQTWEAPAEEFMDLEFGPGPHSTPLAVGGRLFAVGGTGRLVALDAATGRLLWARELWAELDGTRLERGYAASPLASDGLVIVPVGGPGRAVVAFRQSDGTVAWSRLDDGAAYASPILVGTGGETSVVALLARSIAALDPASGALLWSLPLSDRRYVNVTSPYDSGGGLLFLVSSEGGRVLRLAAEADGGPPRELWVGKSLGSQLGNALRFGRHLYGTRGSSASKYLAAVEAESGALAWRDRAIGDCTLLRVGERALALESDGRLHLIRLAPAGLEILASARIFEGRSWTAPALDGTHLFLRDRREIVALELGTAEAAD